MVVVVDAADRENEGDLTIAAQFATPQAVNFMAKEGRGLICLCLTERALRRARAADDDRAQRDALRHRVHRLDRSARGNLDRNLRARSRAHDPGRDRSVERAAGHRAARATCSRCARRRAACSARGADRSRDRPRAARRSQHRRRDLRGDEGRRHDGARSRPDRVLRDARPEARHDRRPDRVPATAREARRARDLRPPSDRRTASSPRRCSARR